MSSNFYDVAIIGAGTAGLSAQKEVSKVTKNYVLIDPGPLGTTCARVGCMPSKVFIQIANDFHRRHVLAKEGIEGAENLKINSQKAMQHVRLLRDRFVAGVLKGLEGLKDHLIEANAEFVDQNTLKLSNGQTIKAKKIIIATGSRPVIPKEWEKYKDFFIDTNQFFELEKLPSSMAVIGLGVIGLELGQAINRLGTKVIGIGRSKKMGGISDPELQEYVAKKLSEEMEICFGDAKILGPKENGIEVKCNDKTWVVEKILLSMGRRPNIDKLNLDILNLKTNEKGIPLFNEGSGQINNSSLFMAGDVNTIRPLLHEAADEGRIAGYNAAREEIECFQKRSLLSITFSDPNIAIVGKSYQKLLDEKIDFAIGKVSFEHQGRAIIKLKNTGLVHIYGDKQNGKIIGAEIFAPEGEHMAHLLSWAISMELNVFEMLALPFYHPVLEEGLRSALRALSKAVKGDIPKLDTPRCQDPPVGG